MYQRGVLRNNSNKTLWLFPQELCTEEYPSDDHYEVYMVVMSMYVLS
jgi:hypothetical protein